MDNIKRVLIISSDKTLREVLNFCLDGWGYEVFLQDATAHDVGPIKKISPDVIVVDIHSASKSHLEICRLLKDDFLTAFIPVITLINKRQLRAQLLNLKQGVDDYLIKPPDPLDLRIRIEMAIRRSLYSYYATPLTGLPGGRIIEEVVTERLKKDAPFSFGYVDIDNFKCFNDVYGYLKGDRVIMQTAYMLYTTIKKFGHPEDFIGHIGGDDFVVVTDPEAVDQICQAIIQEFDKTAPSFYNAEDNANGFIVGHDRKGQLQKIPLLSVSIGVVNNQTRSIKHVAEIGEIGAELKKAAKALGKSNYVKDKRRDQV